MFITLSSFQKMFEEASEAFVKLWVAGVVLCAEGDRAEVGAVGGFWRKRLEDDLWLKSSLESVLLCFRMESETAVMVSDAFFLNKLFESRREVFSTEARVLQFGKAMRSAIGKDVEDVRIQMRRIFEERYTLKAYVTLCTVSE